MNRKFFTTTSTKALLILIAIAPAFAAQAQSQYKLTDLGPSGNPFSQAAGVADNGLIAGVDTAPDGTSHSILQSTSAHQDSEDPIAEPAALTSEIRSWARPKPPRKIPTTKTSAPTSPVSNVYPTCGNLVS